MTNIWEIYTVSNFNGIIGLIGYNTSIYADIEYQILMG